MFENVEIPLSGNLMKQVMDELRKGRMAERFNAYREQRRVASAGQDRYHLPNGEVRMQVVPAAYHYWGGRLGYECWQDKQFVREFLRDNPECRVKSHSRKIMSGYSGKKDEVVPGWSGPSKVRFRKSYGEAA